MSSTQSFNSLLDNVSLEASQAFDNDENSNGNQLKTNNKKEEETKFALNMSRSVDDQQETTTANAASGGDNEQAINPLFSSRTYVKVS